MGKSPGMRAGGAGRADGGHGRTEVRRQLCLGSERRQGCSCNSAGCRKERSVRRILAGEQVLFEPTSWRVRWAKFVAVREWRLRTQRTCRVPRLEPGQPAGHERRQGGRHRWARGNARGGPAEKWRQLGTLRRTAVTGDGTHLGWYQRQQWDEQSSRTMGVGACTARDAARTFTSTETIDGGQFQPAKLPTVGVHPVGTHAGLTAQPAPGVSACFARNAAPGQDVSQRFLPECNMAVCGAHASVHRLVAKDKLAQFGPNACKWMQLGTVRRAVLDERVGVGVVGQATAHLDVARNAQSAVTSMVVRACLTRNATPAYTETGTIDGGQTLPAKLPTVGVHPVGTAQSCCADCPA